MMQRIGWNRRILWFGLLALVATWTVSMAGCNCGKVPPLADGVLPDGGGVDFTPGDQTGPDQPPPPPDQPPCVQLNAPCNNDSQCNPACNGQTLRCFEGRCLSEVIPDTPPPPDTPNQCPLSCGSHDDCRVPACGNRTQCVNGTCSYIPPTCPSRCRSDSDCQTPDCGKRIQCESGRCTAPPECPGACFQDSDCDVVTCGTRKSCEGGKCVELRPNTAPTANAGTDQKALVNQRVSLDGSGSSDPDGDKLSFSWRFLSKPAGSLTALDDPAAERPAFVPDKVGTYRLELVVNDGRDSSQPDVVLIEVSQDASLTPKLSSFSPAQIGVGYPSPSFLLLFGSNFQAGARVSFNKAFVTTRFINATYVAITLPANLPPGSYPVYVQNPGNLNSNTLNFTVTKTSTNDPPVLIRIDPVEVDAGQAFKLSVFGEKFANGAVILFNGSQQTTAFVSDKELSTNIGAQTAGTFTVQIRNPDGKTSATFTLKVKTVKAGPTISTIAPNSVFENQQISVVVTGTRFERSSRVLIGGNPFAVTYISATRLSVSVLIRTAGFYNVEVENTGGLRSNAVQIEVKKPLPAPSISRLSPASVSEKTSVTIAIVGANFENGASVTVGSNKLQGIFVSKTELRVTLPATLTPGSYPVQVTNPDSKTSNSVNLTVTKAAPKPAITKVDPNRVAQASTPTITVTGSNFIKGAQVQVGTRLLPTTFVSATQLTFTLPSNFQVGNYNVRVFNPDNQVSNSLPLEVFRGPPPTLTQLNPNSGIAGGVLTLVLIGTNFVNGSVAVFQGGNQPTNYRSATELTMTLSLSSLSPGTYDVWIRNPDGQTSSKLKFTVKPPAGPQVKQLLPNNGQTNTSVNGIVDGAGFKNGATVQFNGKNLTATFLSTSTLGVVFDLNGINAGTYPVTVTNPGGDKSNIVYFTVSAQKLPKPILTVVNPTTIQLSANKPVYLLGQHFQNGAVMTIRLPVVGGFGMPSNFINSTTLVVTAQFPRIPIPFPPQRTTVLVRNPDKQESNTKPITVSR